MPSSICSGEEAKEIRKYPSPPLPKASPGIVTTFSFDKRLNEISREFPYLGILLKTSMNK